MVHAMEAGMERPGRCWRSAVVVKAFLWLLLPVAVAPLQLPLEIQADRYLVRAEMQIEKQDYVGAKESELRRGGEGCG